MLLSNCVVGVAAIVPSVNGSEPPADVVTVIVKLTFTAQTNALEKRTLNGVLLTPVDPGAMFG